MDDLFPALSPGILHAATPDGGVVYDLVTERLSFLNRSGAALCAACGERAKRSTWFDELAAASGAAVERIARDSEAALDRFREAGFVDRNEPTPTTWPPDAPTSALDADEVATTQAAGMHRVRFRGRDATLVAAVDELLGLGTDEPPTADFRLAVERDAVIRLCTDTEWRFEGVDELIGRLVTVVNDFVARTTTDVVLHAAALRSPAGSTVVFPAAPGSGKSTLAGALLQRGWAYLADESVTIRTGDLAVVPCAKPLGLDASSCAALGLPTEAAGDVPVAAVAPDASIVRHPTARPTAVVSPRYVGPDGDVAVATLGFTDALVACVGNTLNLRYVGAGGLASLVALVTHVPVHTISYRSGAEAVARLAELGVDS
jgi:hypothetical protein